MRTFEIINQLKASGQLSTLLKAGVISPSVNLWYNIYLEYDLKLKTIRGGKSDALFLTAEKFKVTERTVRNAIKTMTL